MNKLKNMCYCKFIQLASVTVVKNCNKQLRLGGRLRAKIVSNFEISKSNT